jgi:hypothetical protein
MMEERWVAIVRLIGVGQTFFVPAGALVSGGDKNVPRKQGTRRREEKRR